MNMHRNYQDYEKKLTIFALFVEKSLRHYEPHERAATLVKVNYIVYVKKGKKYERIRSDFKRTSGN